MYTSELVQNGSHSIRCTVFQSVQNAIRLFDRLPINWICGLQGGPSLVIMTMTRARVRAATCRVAWGLWGYENSDIWQMQLWWKCVIDLMPVKGAVGKPLYETIQILDHSWLISDHSGNLSPDWFGGIHLVCQSHLCLQHNHSSTTGVLMQLCQWRWNAAERGGEDIFLGCLFSKYSSLHNSQILPTKWIKDVPSTALLGWWWTMGPENVERSSLMSTSWVISKALSPQPFLSFEFEQYWRRSFTTW